MKTDIVERLRSQSILDVWHPMMLEAADEIEKLRAALRESDQNFMRVDKERMKLRAKLMAATGELCDRAAAAALKGQDES